MGAFRASVLAALAVAVSLGGCLEPPQRFPVEFVNLSDEAVVFRVIVTNQDGGWSSDDNWTVEAGETYQRQWTLVTLDSYDLNVTVGDASVTDWIQACAMGLIRFEWDGVRIDYANSQGDGWAGC